MATVKKSMARTRPVAPARKGVKPAAMMKSAMTAAPIMRKGGKVKKAQSGRSVMDTKLKDIPGKVKSAATDMYNKASDRIKNATVRDAVDVISPSYGFARRAFDAANESKGSKRYTSGKPLKKEAFDAMKTKKEAMSRDNTELKREIRPMPQRSGGKTKKYQNGGKSFPDLNKDGKITRADILKGRGVIAKKGASVSKKCKYGCK
jgi:hypothetical protein